MNEELTIQDALKILKNHQEWRVGADIEMLNPKAISVAINTVIEYLEDDLNEIIQLQAKISELDSLNRTLKLHIDMRLTLKKIEEELKK